MKDTFPGKIRENYPLVPYHREDSMLFPRNRWRQHSSFLASTDVFPAKPRHQWEAGIKAGL
ncbi:MAG: hypothetical protein JNM88_14940, partial [Chitinophagaceae bacterium]|nr:hypothetical protein [Chitinophagaceae bacterium]